MIGPDGTLLHEYRKPDWSPETLLHLNYINHLSVIRRDSFEKAGGLRPGFDGSQDWDIWLRLSRLPGFSVAHVPKCLYDWRASEHSVAYSSESKPYALNAACTAVKEHLTAKGLKAVDTQPAQEGVGVRSLWQAPCLPLTAIILTHRNPDDLAVLLSDLKAQDYPSLSVCLVANRVTDPKTLELLEQAKSEPGWSVIEDNRPFNWAALNNAAARTVDTPWLLFLNDDVSLPHPDTLRDLTHYLSLDPAIAIVGTRLHFPAQEGNGVQHDGIITDPVWVASDLRDEHASSNEGIRTPRNVSAVTGACLLTRKAVFAACDGFDERLAVSYNDVDYCLHARRLGYRIVQASDVLAIHAHSRTIGFIAPGSPAFLQWEEEKKLMQNKWGTFLSDPHRLQYNRAFAGLRIVHVPDA
jgi:GT2 family glycosyltransferase